jgi:DNA-binding response OmpR family regulator
VKQILLAEDDSGSQMIFRLQLSKLGYDVIVASDGKAGWEKFEQSRPSLVITDWLMPVMDGLQLCRRIREGEGSSYTYIIVLTAMEKASGFAAAIEAGADDFITKPCDIVEMKVRLRVAERILSLQAHVSQLAGLVRICPRCKKMRDYAGAWHAAESYLSDRSEASFSHGICPECYRTIVQPQLDDLNRGEGKG